MVEMYVNEEKRTVAARITGCECDAVNKIAKKYPWVNDVLSAAETEGELMYLMDALRLDTALMEEEYVRKAKCHELDEFDEKTGRDIAFKKVTDAHNRSMAKAVARWEKKILRKMP